MPCPLFDNGAHSKKPPSDEGGGSAKLRGPLVSPAKRVARGRGGAAGHSSFAACGKGRPGSAYSDDETEGEIDYFPPPVTAFSGDSPLV